ncbi:MAG: UPF0158 family protein [Chloroflexota bacterium]
MNDPNTESPRRKLKVNLSDLEEAFENASWEAEYYLDRETGEVILISSMITDSDGITQQLKDVADNGRYLPIPHALPRDGYRDMERFIETVKDTGLHALLSAAINGKGAFRRFKDVLHDYLQERERWFRFQADRVQQRVLEWLDSEDIEPITE